MTGDRTLSNTPVSVVAERGILHILLASGMSTDGRG